MATKIPSKRTKPSKSASLARRNFIIMALGAVALIALIWGAVALLTHRNATAPNSQPSPEASQTVVAHGATGKSVEQDQKDALEAAVKLLNAAGESPTKAQPMDRLQAIEKDDYTVVSKTMVEGVYLYQGAPDGLKKSGYESLITLHTLLTQKLGKTSIEVANPDAYKNVLVDSQLGTAFVPLSTMSGQSSAFDFQMVYVDGKWRLAPYSLVSQVRLSALLSQNSQNGAGQPGTLAPTSKPTP